MKLQNENTLAILDYEAGNQTSVLRALRSLNIPACITADEKVLRAAAGLIFPGVGAARQAMDLLKRTGLERLLTNLVASGKPLLGVCLGCQILLEHSAESDTPTLGLIKGRCLRFDQTLRDEAGEPVIIPHMGWNGYHLHRPSPLFSGIAPDAEFYFVHSYYAEPEPELVIATTRHGLEFCSAYGRDGLWAVQFHPEKSGAPGLALLKNFYAYCLAQAAETKEQGGNHA
ncbi:imidazole glycerol phosphate synthase subunit HisH [Desulfovibrio sp. OttesenSCG-928-M14]|nr:imidazole glycerol phosphate synthase subunit HisH [Desulfovibrio sp. OttesenSCG-928-M14]